MRIKTSILVYLVAGIIVIFLPDADAKAPLYQNHSAPAITETVEEWIKNHPVRFTENKGQLKDVNGQPAPFVLFKAEAPGMLMYITETGLTYAFCKRRKEPVPDNPRTPGEFKRGKKSNKFMDWARIEMILKDASIKRENIITEGKSSDFSQYFLEHCAEGITGVRNYEKITIKNIYSGIDWVFYNSNEKGFKYDFIVHPGANPSQIKLLYKSANELSIDGSGNIVIETPYGKLTENAPVSYLNGNLLKSKFKIISQSKNNFGGCNSEIGFDLEPGTDSCRDWNLEAGTLIIDPQLVWSTFYGGDNNADGPMSIVTDAGGNVFIAGYTYSTDFIVMNPGSGAYFQGTMAGPPTDAFIMKFTNSGVLLWSTYYGGNNDDFANSIAVDANGNIFITGKTLSSNFPLLNPGGGAYFQSSFAGNTDAFVLKFNNSGILNWATYYGGSGGITGFGDIGNSICIDAGGNAIITGSTTSSNFPLLNPGAGAFFQGAYGTNADAFIVKFTNAGIRLWATYFGGSGGDQAYSAISDSNGNIFVTGDANSPNFPSLNPGGGAYYQASPAGSYDAFVSKFSSSGALSWSTFLGGSAADAGKSLAVDGTGNLIVLGITSATNFPLLNPGGGAFFQNGSAGNSDAFISLFSNSGVLNWSTYLGSNGFEETGTYDNLAVDKCGNIYAGLKTSVVSGSPVFQFQGSCDGGYFDNTYGGSEEIIITMFSAGNYALLWSSFIGGNGNDFREALAIDGNNNLFITGEWTDLTSLSGYPLVNPGNGAYYDGTFNSSGDHDGFIMKFEKNLPLTVTSVNANCGCDGSATANPGGSCAPFSYLWSNGQTAQTVTGLCAGNYSVTVANAICGIATASLTITSSGGFSVTATSAPASCTNNNGSATAAPAGGQFPYTYVWSPSGGSSSTATGLSAGSYTVTITDGNGCTNTTTITVTSTGGPTLLVSSVDPLCNGGTNGSATATPTGGNSPYTYLWSNSQTSQTGIGLSAGNYTVTVTDANGCTGTQTVLITQPAAITATASSTSSACGSNNGTANVSVSGGTPNYTYAWSPSGGSSSAASNLASGNYSVTITDANGCTQTSTISVASLNGPSASSSQINVSCFGGNNGSAAITVSGGNPPYSYAWSNGQTASAATNLSAGNYTVTVTDSNGCTSMQTVSLTQPSAITLIVSSTPSACGNNNGTASVAVSGGTGNYTYVWSSGGTSPQISNLASQIYSVTVTDANNCSQTTTVSVADSGVPLAAVSADVTIAPGGSATLTVTGGGSYLWSNGDTSNTISVTPDSTTIYCVTVADTNNCTDTACVTVFVIAEHADSCNYPEESLFVPNAFSPNGDGDNDALGIYYPDISCIKTLRLVIYDRWGEKVYESDSISETWNGTYKGRLMNTAVYVHYLRIKFTSGEEITRHGNISLIR